ncbi:MAG: M67 family metallopeptidase [Synechococcales cyanobacterium RM1_1_8]|nr:M67 family metallopeptidase [Synechococcales cyanobacterium RM1_1_8]
MLYLSPAQFQTMADGAIAAYPQECCGLLLGQILADDHRQATEIRPVANAWTPELELEHQSHFSPGMIEAHSPQDRFAIDPRDLLKAQKEARAQGWQIIGIYHSHPDHPAVPSERDRQSAWPDYSYLILSVEGGAIADLQSWRLNNHNQFTPEPWQLRPAPRASFLTQIPQPPPFTQK